MNRAKSRHVLEDLRTWLDAKCADRPYSPADRHDIEILEAAIEAVEAAEADAAQAGAFRDAMRSAIRGLSRNRGVDLAPHEIRALETLGKPLGVEARNKAAE